MKILLPKRFDENTISIFLSEVIHNGQPVNTDIEFDFSNLTFINPVGLTVLSNTINWLTKNNVQGKLINYKKNNKVIEYLDDSEFFKIHSINRTPLSPHARLRNSTLPLVHIAHNNVHNWLKDKFIRWMSERSQIPEKALLSVKSSLMEIFNNIKDHSEEKIGCCFAQYYRDNNKVVLAVSDFGVGIPYQMSKKYSGSDSKLIIKACEEGISTRSIPQNRGSGLHLLVKNLVELNSCSLMIYSNHGIVKFRKNKSKVHRKYQKNQSDYYPGTLLVVTFYTGKIIYDEEEDFKWSLDS